MSGGPSPAEMYDQYLGRTVLEPLATFVVEQAAPAERERVLDLACGTGIVTCKLPPLVGAEGKVVAVDVSAPMLALAQTKPAPDGCAVEWREGNGCALVDLDNGIFDLVVCQQGLQFFPDRDAGASEMRRVLAPGGRAVVAVWQSLDQQGLFQQLVETQSRVLNLPLEQTAVPFSFGDPAALRTAFEDAGFANVEVIEHEVVGKFPEPAEFVRRLTLSASSVMPQLAPSDLADSIAMAESVLAPVLAHYTKDDHVVVPLKTHVVIAKR